MLHVIQGLNVGGMEKGTLQLVKLSRRCAFEDQILTFDTPPDGPDTYPGAAEVPTTFLKRAPGFDIEFPNRLRTLMLRSGVEIVHAHNDTALFYCALAIHPLKCRPVLVGTYHNAPCHDTWPAKIGARWAGAKANAVLAVSCALAASLKSKGWVNNCSVIANGVDTEEYQVDGFHGDWRRAAGIPEEALLLGHIGRFDANKSQSNLIRAVRSLHLPIPVFLIFVGNGSLLEPVKAFAGNDHRIHFIPRLNDVAEFLRNLDLFIICSKDEGAPRAMLEAMACERAVIATNVGGIPEILHAPDGPCGVLVPVDDPAGLARAIAELSTSWERRREMGVRARRRIINSYNIEQQWRRYERNYQLAIHRMTDWGARL